MVSASNVMISDAVRRILDMAGLQDWILEAPDNCFRSYWVRTDGAKIMATGCYVGEQPVVATLTSLETDLAVLKAAGEVFVKMSSESSAETNPANIDKGSDEFELARKLHRVVRAMHDGHCPNCGHLAPSEQFHREFGHVCPECKFRTWKSDELTALAMFRPYLGVSCAEYVKHFSKHEGDQFHHELKANTQPELAYYEYFCGPNPEVRVSPWSEERVKESREAMANGGTLHRNPLNIKPITAARAQRAREMRQTMKLEPIKSETVPNDVDIAKGGNKSPDRWLPEHCKVIDDDYQREIRDRYGLNYSGKREITDDELLALARCVACMQDGTCPNCGFIQPQNEVRTSHGYSCPACMFYIAPDEALQITRTATKITQSDANALCAWRERNKATQGTGDALETTQSGN